MTDIHYRMINFSFNRIFKLAPYNNQALMYALIIDEQWMNIA